MARPNLSYLKNVSLVLTGIPCGLLVGLTGIGIGVLLLPVVGYLLGPKALKNPGTIEAVSLSAAAAGLVAYLQNGYVAWPLALLLLMCQIIGAALAQRAGITSRTKPALLRAGAIVAILIGLSIAAASRMHAPWLDVSGHQAVLAQFTGASHHSGFIVRAMVVGLLAGIVSEAFDLGGLLLPMAVTFGLGLAPQWAQGISLAACVPLYALILPLRAKGGLIEARPAVWISFGAVLGALFGGQTAAGSLSAHALLVMSATLFSVLGILRFLQTTPKK